MKLGTTHYIAVLTTLDGARKRVLWPYDKGMPAMELRFALPLPSTFRFDSHPVAGGSIFPFREYILVGYRRGDRRFVDYKERH